MREVHREPSEPNLQLKGDNMQKRRSETSITPCLNEDNQISEQGTRQEAVLAPL